MVLGDPPPRFGQRPYFYIFFGPFPKGLVKIRNQICDLQIDIDFSFYIFHINNQLDTKGRVPKKKYKSMVFDQTGWPPPPMLKYGLLIVKFFFHFFWLPICFKPYERDFGQKKYFCKFYTLPYPLISQIIFWLTPPPPILIMLFKYS